MALVEMIQAREYLFEHWQLLLPFASISLIFLWLRTTSTISNQNGRTPLSISESFPLQNAYRYIFHNMDFLDYISKNFTSQNVLQFHMGPKGFYLINSAANANAIVRSSGHLSSDALIFMAMGQLDGVCASDINKYKNDKTSRTQMTGINVPEKERTWAPVHRLFLDHLASKSGVSILQGKFQELFTKTLDKRGNNGWEEAQLYQLLQKEMANAAIVAFAGEEILELSDGFVEAMWGFDDFVYPLALSTPRFLYSKPYKARENYHKRGAAWLHSVIARYDWESKDDPDWEPMFGSRYFRQHTRFFLERDFKESSILGLLLGAIWASNANSIPMTGWMLIHVIQDPILYATVRKLSLTAYTNGKLDATKLCAIPLFQSLYAETLRMHVSVNITREVMQDMKLDGYALKKGYLVQTPSHIAHFDPHVWGDGSQTKPGETWKPVSEFWAERHLKYVNEVDAVTGDARIVPVFSTDGRTGGFFPYGGGNSLCPGRHFAKAEMLTAVALIVVQFDVEVLGYVFKDGKTSERGPEDDKWYCGAAAMPPDRDLRVRWRKVGGGTL